MRKVRVIGDGMSTKAQGSHGGRGWVCLHQSQLHACLFHSHGNSCVEFSPLLDWFEVREDCSGAVSKMKDALDLIFVFKYLFEEQDKKRGRK